MLNFLCESSFKFENWSLHSIGFPIYRNEEMAFFIPPQNQTHTIYMQGLFPCPASPTRPPDVQISLSPASASLQRRAT